MDKEIKISVVMSAYNERNNIEKAVESIVKQSFKQWELIFVNEFGSNDGTYESVKKWAQKDERIALIQNTKRLGFPASLNIGIKKAKGKYIARMDADDFSLPQRLEKQYLYMEANPKIDLISSNYYYTLNDNVQKEIRLPGENDEIKAEMLFRDPICHPAVLFRREVFQKLDLYYNEKLEAAEDYELWIRAFPLIKFANLQEPLIVYQQGYNDFGRYNQYEKGFEVCARYCRVACQDYFGIDVSLYSNWIFAWGMSGLNHKMRKDSISSSLVQIFHLFCNMENANETKKLIKCEIFRRTLKRQWNNALYKMHMPESISEKYLCWIPELGEVKNKRFEEEFQDKLSKRGINEDALQFIYNQSMKGGKIIPDHAKIIMWGAGKRFWQFMNWLSDKKIDDFIELAGVSDKDSDRIEQLETSLDKFYAKEISDQIYDYIIVTPDNCYDEIEKELEDQYEVNVMQVLPLSCLYKKIEDKESIK